MLLEQSGINIADNRNRLIQYKEREKMKFKGIKDILLGGYEIDSIYKGIDGGGWRRAYKISNTNQGAYGYCGEFCIAGQFNNGSNVSIIFSVVTAYMEASLRIHNFVGSTVIDKIRITKNNDTDELNIDFHYNTVTANVYGFKKISGYKQNSSKESYADFKVVPSQPDSETIMTEVIVQ